MTAGSGYSIVGSGDVTVKAAIEPLRTTEILPVGIGIQGLAAGLEDALAELARTGFLKHISVSIDGPGELHDKARGVAGTFERTAATLKVFRRPAKK